MIGKLLERCHKNNLTVIEDSADTLGSKLNGKLSGFYTDWSITSFYGSHIINCAGNGMLCLNMMKCMLRQNFCSWGRSCLFLMRKVKQ